MREYVSPQSGSMTAARLGFAPFAIGALAGKAAAAAVAGAASVVGMAAASKMMRNDFSSPGCGALKPVRDRGLADVAV